MKMQQSRVGECFWLVQSRQKCSRPPQLSQKGLQICLTTRQNAARVIGTCECGVSLKEFHENKMKRNEMEQKR